ncbi:hypothetical protein DRJ25_03600 [Candidatus Woesearchaeota archaeon]|nr:MAG: hypothetical protein DRJ25_03600 [Candidatus Woesearchaeota archaeon]
MGAFKMGLTTIIACIISATGFLIGRTIRKTCKDEIKTGEEILRLTQNLAFGTLLTFLLITANLGLTLAIAISTAYAAYSFLKKKGQNNTKTIIVAAIIAITFRTSLFLYGAGTSFIYTLITGIRTKSWRTTIKDATLLLAATLTLIYLRTL